MKFLIIFLTSFMIVYLTIPTIRSLALKFYFVDKKNGRKIHKKVVTKLGGIGIYFGIFCSLIIICFYESSFFRDSFSHIFGLTFCSTLMLLLGIYDDVQGSDALTKFLTQTLIAFLLVKTGFRLETIIIPGALNINFGILSLPITIFWLVGITNAINMIDGLDGLAAGIICIVSFFLGIYGILFDSYFVVFVALAIIGANLAFLKYNFYPAKIFMGDTGSLMLGFIIGALAIFKPEPATTTNIFFLPALFMLSVPILDVTLAIIRRTLRKQHIFRSDFSHIHHYVVKQGFSQTKTVVTLYIITLFLGSSTLLAYFLSKYFRT